MRASRPGLLARPPGSRSPRWSRRGPACPSEGSRCRRADHLDGVAVRSRGTADPGRGHRRFHRRMWPFASSDEPRRRRGARPADADGTRPRHRDDRAGLARRRRAGAGGRDRPGTAPEQGEAGRLAPEHGHRPRRRPKGDRGTQSQPAFANANGRSGKTGRRSCCVLGGDAVLHRPYGSASGPPRKRTAHRRGRLRCQYATRLGEHDFPLGGRPVQAAGHPGHVPRASRGVDRAFRRRRGSSVR